MTPSQKTLVSTIEAEVLAARRACKAGNITLAKACAVRAVECVLLASDGDRTAVESVLTSGYPWWDFPKIITPFRQLEAAE